VVIVSSLSCSSGRLARKGAPRRSAGVKGEAGRFGRKRVFARSLDTENGVAEWEICEPPSLLYVRIGR